MRGKLCLNLVCKNEEAVIARCLESCLRIIDSWCVVDTGSSDKTMEIVRQTLGHLPGFLYERPWINFGHNKTEAMRLAQPVAEYALLMDADDMLVFSSTFKQLPPLVFDSYALHVVHAANLEHNRTHIVRTDVPFEYKEPVHEYLDFLPYSRGKDPIAGVIYKVVGGGARSADPIAKFMRDASLLERDLQDRPGHARSIFYLAQSYRDAGTMELDSAGAMRGVAAALRAMGDEEKAREEEAKASLADDRAERLYRLSLEFYEKRAAVTTDWGEEAIVAKLEAAKKKEHLHSFGAKAFVMHADVVLAYMEAWGMCPTRAEPLYELARYCRSGGQFHLAYLFASVAIKIPMPIHGFFIDASVYRWRARDEFAIVANLTGRWREAVEACKIILASPYLPEGPDRERIKNNLRLSRTQNKG